MIRSVRSREWTDCSVNRVHTLREHCSWSAIIIQLFPDTLYNANAIAMQRNESGYNQRSVTKWYIGVTGMTLRLGANRVGTIISRERDKARVKGVGGEGREGEKEIDRSTFMYRSGTIIGADGIFCGSSHLAISAGVSRSHCLSRRPRTAICSYIVERGSVNSASGPFVSTTRSLVN